MRIFVSFVTSLFCCNNNVYCIHAAVIEQSRLHKFSVAFNQVQHRYPRGVVVGGSDSILVTSMMHSLHCGCGMMRSRRQWSTSSFTSFTWFLLFCNTTSLFACLLDCVSLFCKGGHLTRERFYHTDWGGFI